MEAIIWRTEKGRVINYDWRNTDTLPEEWIYTIKTLSSEEMEEIRKAEWDKIDELLSKYI